MDQSLVTGETTRWIMEDYRVNMTLQDKERLRIWLASRVSLGEVESTARYGLVGNERFTGAAVRAYKLLWTWSAPRFSDVAGKKQESYFSKCGMAALYRRYERCKAIAAKLARS